MSGDCLSLASAGAAVELSKMKVCVNCGVGVVDKNGRPHEQLYDQKLAEKLSIIKLLECDRCGQNVDKYIEYEGCLVLLDLALQELSAFRHVLINCDHANVIVKMMFLTLIVDGYSRWSSESEDGQFLEREFEFYLSVGWSVASLITFLLTTLFTTFAAFSVKDRGTCRPNVSLLVTGLLLSYCARFLKLGALLWATDSTQFLWPFVNLLFFLTSRNVMKVVCSGGLRSGHCTVITLVSHASLLLFEAVESSTRI